MTADAVVEDFNVVKDPMPRLGSGCVETGVDFLYLQGVKEGPGTRSSSPTGFHREALTEPYVSLSAHTALVIQP